MTMRKAPTKITEKLEKKIVNAVTSAAMQSNEFNGFLRFEYEVDWSNFPVSLKFKALFHSEAAIATLKHDGQQNRIEKYVLNALMKQGVRVKDIRKLMTFEVVDN